MKESGKLIELLSEYGEYDLVEHKGNICKRDTDDEGEINIYTDYTAIIISKKFGFIKWLVDNDKINTNHLSLQAFKNIFSGGGFVKVSDLEVLLMLLSIEDNPIEFLIGILE